MIALNQTYNFKEFLEQVVELFLAMITSILWAMWLYHPA